MSQVIVEENLRFTFDDSWSVTKLDEHAFFRERLMPLQLTRAVDFLAFRQLSALYLIEVKDFRGSAIELKNHEKMCAGDNLLLQVARKSKDSIACIAGAARISNDGFWSQCADVLRKRGSILKVVFWLEFDLERIHNRCSGCHGHACVAMPHFSRGNMPTTSVGMAPKTLHRA
jgi:hypothetical protein